MRSAFVFRGSFSACLLCVLLLIFCSGSSASALWSDGFERTLGKGAAPEIIEKHGGEYILPIQERLWLDEIFRRLVEVTERSEIEYSLTVLNSFEYNAFALPGGYIFITRGLLHYVDFDPLKVAAVLGHEIAHVEKRHGINAVLRQMGFAVVMEMGVLWLDSFPPELLRVASATLMQLLQLGWGREAEYEADLLGQALAAKASFDPIGAVAVLDDLLLADPQLLPTSIFSSHPDTLSRRRRTEQNLASFWPEPEGIPEKRAAEISMLSRNYEQNGRNDPSGRLVIALAENGGERGVSVYDSRRNETSVWLEDIRVQNFCWSPQGGLVAFLVQEDGTNSLWLTDRSGRVLKKYRPPAEVGSIQAASWSPCSEMIALEVKGPFSREIVITYAASEVYFKVSGAAGGRRPVWLETGLFFENEGAWQQLLPPMVEPVQVADPVPRVVERKRLLSPSVIREGDSIRLTRPSLILP